MHGLHFLNDMFKRLSGTHADTHYKCNCKGTSIAGHVIYLAVLHKNYGCHEFLLNVPHNITNKCELFMSFIASISVL